MSASPASASSVSAASPSVASPSRATLNRFQTLSEFWPHYLGEHRIAADRALHFLGTTWMFVCLAAALVLTPATMIPALLGMVAVGWIASARIERNRPAFREMMLLFVLACVGNYVLMPIGIVGAYFLAWCGHFGIEHNKPAAFKYPVWSFISDFRVWGLMATGRLWSGDPMAGRPLTPAKTVA